MSQHSIRIAIVNDYEVVVAGLAQMLEPFSQRVEVVEVDVCASAQQDIDVALYDTFAQARGGGPARTAALGENRAARLVVYGWTTDPSLAQRSIDEGASGYLSKRLGAAELVRALERVHAGEQVVELDPGEGAGLSLDRKLETSRSSPRDWPGRHEGLSERESEIVALVVQGLSNDQVAARAFVSVNTIKFHLQSAYRKMGVESRSQAVLWGVDHGFRPDRAAVRRSVHEEPEGEPGEGSDHG